MKIEASIRDGIVVLGLHIVFDLYFVYEFVLVSLPPDDPAVNNSNVFLRKAATKSEGSMLRHETPLPLVIGDPLFVDFGL